MWPRRTLIDLLGIEHPIIQAPMAGVTTPALAAAVSNAGGMGSLGCAALSLDQLRAATEAMRATTNGAYNLNFFAYDMPPAPADNAAAARARLQPLYDELGAEAPATLEPIMPPFDGDMLEIVLATRPKVVSFHFGLPADDLMAPLRETGILILASATCVADAKTLEAAGCAAIVAQGAEAGGHLGTFDDNSGGIGTMALVPMVADAVSVPVIAAGGIADGRGIAAAFALGAAGAQIGTAFIGCPESAANPLYRQTLAAARDDATRATRAFTGRTARGLKNRLTEALLGHDAELALYPYQRRLSAPLAAKAEAAGSGDFTSMWAGQAVGLARALPAAELMATLVSEAQEAMRR